MADDVCPKAVGHNANLARPRLERLQQGIVEALELLYLRASRKRIQYPESESTIVPRTIKESSPVCFLRKQKTEPVLPVSPRVKPVHCYHQDVFAFSIPSIGERLNPCYVSKYLFPSGRLGSQADQALREICLRPLKQ